MVLFINNHSITYIRSENETKFPKGQIQILGSLGLTKNGLNTQIQCDRFRFKFGARGKICLTIQIDQNMPSHGTYRTSQKYCYWMGPASFYNNQYLLSVKWFQIWLIIEVEPNDHKHANNTFYQVKYLLFKHSVILSMQL